MDQNKKRKSKALVITIIAIIILLVVGFFLLRSSSVNSTSNVFARIFSSLNPSGNSKNVNIGDEKKLAQAGEDLNKGDKVVVTGNNTDNNPVVMRANSNSDMIFGVADQNISSGDIGEISLVSGNGWGAFWDSISDLLNNTFGGGSNSGDLGNGGTGGDIGTGTGGDIGTGGTGIGTGGDLPTDMPECSDRLDNDGDNFIDRNDPECHLDGDLTKPYIPGYNSESNFPNQNDLFECNDTIDNDSDTFIDDKDPQCHLGGDLNNQYVPTHNSETTPPEEEGLPDLTAGPISPTSATSNSITSLQVTVSNEGTKSTESGFQGIFTIKKIADVNPENGENENNISQSPIKNFLTKLIKKVTLITKVFAFDEKEIAVNISTVLARSSQRTSTTYTFDSIGIYEVRFCADKKTIADTGMIVESNEDNNCGPWTAITISNSLPTGGDTGGFGLVDPECSDKIDNDNDELTDELDPACHKDGDLNKEYIPEHYSERIPPNGGNVVVQNKCLVIEQNPLIFTDAQKAKLAELLRRFYVIAPTLKSETDILSIYSEIDQYKNLIGKTNNLIEQCYAQVNSKMDDGYAWHRRGNPWYSKETDTTLPYGNEPYADYNLLMGYDFGDTAYNGEKAGCYAISGYYYGTDKDDKDCDWYNRNPYMGVKIDNGIPHPQILPPPAPACWGDTYGQFGNDEYAKEEDQSGHPNQYILQNGCKWQPGVNMEALELILKIW